MINTEEIQAMANRIVDAFQPERIILFGSYAYGQPTPDSDVDFLVLTVEKADLWTQAKMVLAAQPEQITALHIPMDIIVATPEQALKGLHENNPIFKPAMSKGKILYDRYR